MNTIKIEIKVYKFTQTQVNTPEQIQLSARQKIKTRLKQENQQLLVYDKEIQKRMKK